MHNSAQPLRANALKTSAGAAVMYVDMNSFFASCEQQLCPELRGKPIGVTAGDKPYSVIVAPSIEAKRFGVKTGMRANECRYLCPQLIAVPARPVAYRHFHIAIMGVLRSHCEDVLAKSIDEAAMNLTSYRAVYKDLPALARTIKAQIQNETEKISGQQGSIIRCSIGIAPNTFLAKLATDLQKPDGLVEITHGNLDDCLARMELKDLPGIGPRNARRLELIGIKTPLQMRHTSQSLLRKAFGGIVGYYWHCRLNFAEVDFRQSHTQGMSATRTTSPEQRASLPRMEALLVSICTKLEQRLVMAGIFCRHATFCLRYQNGTSWETSVRFGAPLQDATEMRQYLTERMEAFERERRTGRLLNTDVKQLGITIGGFVAQDCLQYSLFDDRMKQDKLRRVVYGIKDQYGKYAVRKASEMVERSGMKDAIGFGSVRDLYEGGNGEGSHINRFLLEETDE